MGKLIFLTIPQYASGLSFIVLVIFLSMDELYTPNI